MSGLYIKNIRNYSGSLLGGNCWHLVFIPKILCFHHKLLPSSVINKVNIASLRYDAWIKLFQWIILPRSVKSAYSVPLTATAHTIRQFVAALSLNLHHKLKETVFIIQGMPGKSLKVRFVHPHTHVNTQTPVVFAQWKLQ